MLKYVSTSTVVASREREPRPAEVTCIIGQADGERLGETNSVGGGMANHLSLRYGRLRARTSSRI